MKINQPKKGPTNESPSHVPSKTKYLKGGYKALVENSYCIWRANYQVKLFFSRGWGI
jgi:hypothetical protein